MTRLFWPVVLFLALSCGGCSTPAGIFLRAAGLDAGTTDQ